MKKIILAVVFFIFLSQVSFSLDILNFITSVDLDDNGNSVYTIEIIFKEPHDSLRYFTYSKISDLKVLEDGNETCKLEYNDIGSVVSCNLKNSKRIKFSYYRPSSSERKDGKFIFSDNFLFPYGADNVIVEIKLPEGFGLVNGNNSMIQSCVPSDCIKASDGRRVVILWNEKNIGENDNLYISVLYENITKGSSFLYFILIPAFLVVAIIVFFVYRKRFAAKMMLPVLKEDEKKVMEAILKYGDGVNQKIIVRETNYSKAKVSKVLKSLSERGIVRLERTGRTNRIFLSSKFENKA